MRIASDATVDKLNQWLKRIPFVHRGLKRALESIAPGQGGDPLRYQLLDRFRVLLSHKTGLVPADGEFLAREPPRQALVHVSQERAQSAEFRAAFERSARDTFFINPTYLDTEAGRTDLESHAVGRYRDWLSSILPWIARSVSLDGMRVLEIGCGTGSSTAALAPFVGQIVGLDIDHAALELAAKRLALLDLHNVVLRAVSPETLVSEMAEHRGEGVNLVLLWAVLEHQTLTERLRTLGEAWRVLRPGGYLVIGDTPNRLSPQDDHTSVLPFFSMLPDALALEILPQSPRSEFRDDFASGDLNARIERLYRWGRGVSFHEFQLALGSLEGLCVADGFQREMLENDEWIPSIESGLLAFAQRHLPAVPTAFFRNDLNLILRKQSEPRQPGLPQFRTPSWVKLDGCVLNDAPSYLLTGPESRLRAKVGDGASLLLIVARSQGRKMQLVLTDDEGKVIRRIKLSGPIGEWINSEIELHSAPSQFVLRSEPEPGALAAGVEISLLGWR